MTPWINIDIDENEKKKPFSVILDLTQLHDEEKGKKNRREWDIDIPPASKKRSILR